MNSYYAPIYQTGFFIHEIFIGFKYDNIQKNDRFLYFTPTLE